MNDMKRVKALDKLAQLRLPEELAVRIDDWRRRQTDIPSRSEAIRRLVDRGLKSPD